ncbi:acetyl-CoA synthetase-like protein [Hesseltinella vesiculosa]|uniref:Acetyl-CoA synthetase-like protein n=1 Tax=Hesseltinella vesiculosa TaxID=101127 RepID=A0A1X2G2S8_9FUNG|nr:acetyl-CoA synthetase-like protein [Hesseltinella vesiculosa]
MSIELDTVSYALLASIFGATAFLSLRSSHGSDIHPILLNSQADVSRIRHVGESATYRSRMYPNGSPLLSTVDRNIRSLHELFHVGIKKRFSQQPFLGQFNHADYQWASYDKTLGDVEALFRGLSAAVPGLQVKSNDASSFVGIYGHHSSSCHVHGWVTIPIGAKSTSSHIDHVIKTTGLKVLAVDTAHLDQILSLIPGTSVNTLILLNGAASLVADKTVQVLVLDDLVAKGQKLAPAELAVPDANTIASINFSSASPSDPGVVLSHKNYVAAVASQGVTLPQQQRVGVNDRFLCNLPIDNAFGYVLTLFFGCSGASVAFAPEYSQSERVATYLETVAAAQPTVFASTSPLLAVIRDHIEQHYGGSFLFRRGYDKKLANMENGRLVTDSKYDMLVFRDIQRKVFGGKLRWIYLENDQDQVAPFFRAVMNAQVIQVLNQTETCGTTTSSIFYDYQGHGTTVGVPLPCNEVKLMDAADQGYRCDDLPNPRGEVCVRGINVFQGYWQAPELTLDVLDADGWYMTGWLAEILPNGTLNLLGRK